MTTNLNEFHDAFFEESEEALAAMEAGLLALDLSAPDAETINTIFRGAHSMKGGAGMFGFESLASFTHTVETLLDQVRERERELGESDRDLLLRAVDCCREMIQALQSSTDGNPDKWVAVSGELERVLSTSGATAPGAASNDAPSPAPATETVTGFRIVPERGFFAAGHEPLRVLGELAELGEMQVSATLADAPSFAEADAELCYLQWNVALSGEATRDQVEEIFAWVNDECALEFGGDDTTDERAPAPATEPDETAAIRPASDATTAPGAQTAAPEAPRAASTKSDTGSIRVAIDKVDALINLVGELVITQSMLGQFTAGDDDASDIDIDQLRNGLAQLERNTRELQESVMQIRMLPISFSFNRFPRLVRDLSNKLGKQVELEMSGERTELDKTVLEKIADPLVHIVRNSLDHGIESPDEREAAGKPRTGTVRLNAYHQGGNIVIEVSDDGGGISQQKIRDKAVAQGLINDEETYSPQEINQLIFHPGLSTAEAVSDVSGRGVGMDVVQRNIMELGGTVTVESEEGVGSTMTIRLPLTLAIVDGQLVRVAGDVYIIPLVSIVESIQCNPALASSFAEGGELYRVRDEYIPVIRLRQAFGLAGPDGDLSNGLLVVVEAQGKQVGLFVDELMGQQQVVIKSLETNFRTVPGLSGATILGDGTVALILDAPGLIRLFQDKSNRRAVSLAA